MVGVKVSCMKSIGIILNPSARINKKTPSNIIDELKIIFGDTAMIFPTSSKEETADVINDFDKEELKFLLISGGDGTICNVLTSYINLWGKKNLPIIVPLMGGTINMIGADVGLRENQLSVCRKLNSLIKNKQMIPVTERGLLEISDSNLSQTNYGFTWIDGLLYKFMLDYYTQGAGVQVASMLAIKTILMSIADSENGIFSPIDSTVYIDKKELPKKGHVFVISSCLKKFVFGFNIFHDQPEPGVSFNTVYMREPYLKKSKHKIPLGLYKGLESDDSGDFINQSVSNLRIQRNKGYIIDGEIYEHDIETEIIIKSGPKVNIFSQKGEKELSILGT
ncbi:MAG: diacylglycerol kinase family protein [Thermodesulfobacteriota bacterium]